MCITECLLEHVSNNSIAVKILSLRGLSSICSTVEAIRILGKQFLIFMYMSLHFATVAQHVASARHQEIDTVS